MQISKFNIQIEYFIGNVFLQQDQRIEKLAAKSHKEKVAAFNKHLDSISEHFDIPRVRLIAFWFFFVGLRAHRTSCLLL